MPTLSSKSSCPICKACGPSKGNFAELIGIRVLMIDPGKGKYPGIIHGKRSTSGDKGTSMELQPSTIGLSTRAPRHADSRALSTCRCTHFALAILLGHLKQHSRRTVNVQQRIEKLLLQQQLALFARDRNVVAQRRQVVHVR